jgi:hypothetical protein
MIERAPTLTFLALQLSQALRSLVFGSEGVCGVVGAGAGAGAGPGDCACACWIGCIISG